MAYNIDNIKMAQIKNISNEIINENDTQKRKEIVTKLKEKLEILLRENNYLIEAGRGK